MAALILSDFCLSALWSLAIGCLFGETSGLVRSSTSLSGSTCRPDNAVPIHLPSQSTRDAAKPPGYQTQTAILHGMPNFTSLLTNIQNSRLGNGEMTQRLTLAVFPDDPGSIPSTHMYAYIHL